MYMHTYIHTHMCRSGQLAQWSYFCQSWPSKMLTLVLLPLWPHKVADPAERFLSPRVIVFATHSLQCCKTHSEHSAIETEGISRSSVVGLSRTRTTVFLLFPLPSPSLSLLFLPVSLCKHTCVVLYVCVYLHGGQRTTLDALSQVLSTALFLWDRFSGLEFPRWGNRSFQGPQAPAYPCFFLLLGY